MRLRSDVWVAAYIRTANAAGAFAVLQRRGADEAGAIFIAVEGDDRAFDLYVPAPQAEIGAGEVDRIFRRHPRSGALDAPALAELIARETRFDPDLWIIAVEDRTRRNFLENVIADEG